MPEETSKQNGGAPSFDEFEVPTYEEWYETAVKSLKGAAFEKKLITRTYEDIDLHPLYRQEDAANIAHRHTLPGQPPYVRGIQAEGYLQKGWEVAQEIQASTPEAFNAALLHDMARGQTAVNLVLDQPSRTGFDPDQSEQVGHDGVSIATAVDLAHALHDVDLTTTPLFVHVGASGLPFLSLLVASQKSDVQSLSGCIESDPLGEIIQHETLPLTLEQAYDEMATLTKWAADNTPNLDTIAVHSAPYHNAGASAVQELAFAVSTGVEYLRAMVERGVDVNIAAAKMRFMFTVGANFFMEVAKLRAARLLWSQIVAAFGGDEGAQKMKQHARTATYNKTFYDPYVNMLRTTIEGMAGAVGGVQSMHIAPFDEVFRTPDSFSRRVARNQQLILQQEAHLAQIIDPAGGSWYVEYLTDQLAQHAWTLFQKVEGAGGMFAALSDGFPQAEIAEVAARRTTNLARRKDRLVGTNMYPNLQEKALEADAIHYEAIQTERAGAIQKARKDDISFGDHSVDALVTAAKNGATLGQFASALRPDDAQKPIVTPVRIHRLAEPFETLRKAAADYAVQNGHPPQIFMANMGPLVQHKARADFSTGFFEVGGFEMLNQDGFETPEDAAQAAIHSGAKAVIICSTDATYPEIVPPLVKAIKTAKPETVVILAGYPQDQIEAHKEAGVDEFIHLRANCYEMNAWLQQQLGVTSA